MNNILKTNRIAASLLFAAIAFAGVAAPAGAITLPTGGSADFAATQQKVLALIDASVSRLNAAEASIQGNTQISSATKTDVLNSLNNVEAGLLAYRVKVAAATTMAELQAINQEIVQYLITNKDVIKANAKLVIADIGKSASAKAAEIAVMAQQMLKVLSVSCPSQKTAIDSLSKQITELQANAAALKAAATAKDTAAVKALTQKTATLVKAMVANMKAIEANCVIPTP